MGKYIIVNGVMGSGKSTLCNEIAGRILPKPVVLNEIYENNPYIAQYPQPGSRKMFKCQKIQIDNQKTNDRTASALLSQGFSVIQDTSLQAIVPIYCDETLMGKYFQRTIEYAFKNYIVPNASLKIFLCYSPEVLFERIKNRARGFEVSQLSKLERLLPVYCKGLDEIASSLNNYKPWLVIRDDSLSAAQIASLAFERLCELG